MDGMGMSVAEGIRMRLLGHVWVIGRRVGILRGKDGG